MSTSTPQTPPAGAVQTSRPAGAPTPHTETMNPTTHRGDSAWHDLGCYVLPVLLVALTAYYALLTLAGISRPALLTGVLAVLWASLAAWGLIQMLRHPRAAYGSTAAVASLGVLVVAPVLPGGAL